MGKFIGTSNVNVVSDHPYEYQAGHSMIRRTAVRETFLEHHSNVVPRNGLDSGTHYAKSDSCLGWKCT